MRMTRELAADEARVEIDTPSRYACLRTIRMAVLDACSKAGMEELKAGQLEMAVDEACSNVIEHSYGGEQASLEQPSHPGIRVTIVRNRDAVMIEIVDRGQGFAFDDQQTVGPDEYVNEGRTRGLGLFIIRRFVDFAAYKRGTPEGNILRLTKRV